MPEPTDPQTLYPAGLLRWAGHRDGGVRKPFRSDSGRPTGSRITTPLVARLQSWVTDLLANTATTPRTVLLVGGPGNGKTDAIETCIEFLDAGLKADGNLVRAFAESFDVPEGQLPPRKVVVELTKLGINLPAHLHQSITLVQDATEGDPAQDRPAEHLLLEELGDRLDSQRSGIYLCCVNRGILAHAATVAQESIREDNAAELLNKITAAVTSGPTSPRCWPLAGFEHFAVWPMDVESLVDETIAEDGQTVAHQIFAAALDQTKWNPACEAGTRCPFCQNRELLSHPDAVTALVKLLRYYELASGKRWTFRDLFSLIPHLLVGDYSELEVRGRQVTPCEWSAYQNQLIRASQTSDPSKYRAPYLLVSRLYHHRLFPRWPGLDRGQNRKAKSALHVDSFTPGLERARDFFRYLSHAANQSGDNSGEIVGRVRGSLGELLDPALAPGDRTLFSRGDQDITIDQVEERFSLSVREGLSFVSNRLEQLERDLLAQLAEADESLVEENFPRIKAHHAKLLQNSLRQFCARLVKRSIGVKKAVCRDSDYFQSYERALRDSRELSDVRRQLKKLLHDDRNQFRASLVTTFGQPVAQRSRDIVLLTPAVSVREMHPTETSGRPAEPIPYLRVDSHVVPLTFSLFKALREVVAGLHDASLPAEIFALLNGIKSLVSGHLVRNASILDEESRIELGNSGQFVEISRESFHFVEADHL
jgi:hypothetical protein